MEEAKQKNTLKILALFLIGVVIVLSVIFIVNYYKPHIFTYSDELKKFNSSQEIIDFIKAGQQSESSGGFGDVFRSFKGVSLSAPSASMAMDSAAGESGNGASDFSATNIQVEGVDEADIVKNDGKYIYSVLGGSGKLVIVEAYPADNMKILSETNISGITDIFVNGDKLIVFARSYRSIKATEEESAKCAGSMKGGCLVPYDYSTQTTDVFIYNIEDRENLSLENNISIEGNYVQSRMIGGYVYIIASKYVNIERPEPPVYILDGLERQTSATDVYYFDYPDYSYNFNTIAAVKISNGDFNSKVYLMGGTGVVYVSQDNIYLTHSKRVDNSGVNEKLVEEVYLKVLPSEERRKAKEIRDSDKVESERVSLVRAFVYNYSMSLTGDEKANFDKELEDKLEEFNKDIMKEMEKTTIHKINVDKLDINYIVAGDVAGHLLNQFSMDEYNGYFRVATTTGEVWGGNSLNHIFVLNENMEVVGGVEDIAPGEKIYSARFLGNRAYLVTFKKIDPFFVIDLKNPEKPKILGYLKIPGYSDYLHPYDENHVIGIGKEAIDASSSDVERRNLDFAWYQGVKIALFDVTDVENPKEEAKFVIGDRGTDSSALYEHKAFLFDKEKKLLVLPINLALINRSRYADQENLPPAAYGEHVWSGAYVLNIDSDEISLRGRITHNNESEETDNRYYWYGSNKQIQRSLFMDNVLYTISEGMIKANDLETVDEINSLKMPVAVNDY